MKKKGKGIALIVLVVCIAVPLYRCSQKSKELREQVKSYTATTAQTTTAAATEAVTTTPTEATTTTTTTTTTAPETTTTKKKTKPKTTTTAAPEPTPEDIRKAVQNGDFSLVTPEFKATMDAYEAFYDDYLAFMKKYNSGTGDMMAMLNDYMDMLAKMEEWSNKIDAIDETKLTPADDAYYLLVTLRIENKLIGAM